MVCHCPLQNVNDFVWFRHKNRVLAATNINEVQPYANSTVVLVLFSFSLFQSLRLCTTKNDPCMPNRREEARKLKWKKNLPKNSALSLSNYSGRAKCIFSLHKFLFDLFKRSALVSKCWCVLFSKHFTLYNNAGIRMRSFIYLDVWVCDHTRINKYISMNVFEWNACGVIHIYCRIALNHTERYTVNGVLCIDLDPQTLGCANCFGVCIWHTHTHTYKAREKILMSSIHICGNKRRARAHQLKWVNKRVKIK